MIDELLYEMSINEGAATPTHRPEEFFQLTRDHMVIDPKSVSLEKQIVFRNTGPTTIRNTYLGTFLISEDGKVSATLYDEIHYSLMSQEEVRQGDILTGQGRSSFVPADTNFYGSDLDQRITDFLKSTSGNLRLFSVVRAVGDLNRNTLVSFWSTPHVNRIEFADWRHVHEDGSILYSMAIDVADQAYQKRIAAGAIEAPNILPHQVESLYSPTSGATTTPKAASVLPPVAAGPSLGTEHAKQRDLASTTQFYQSGSNGRENSGIILAMSGGGLRATLFHLGVFAYLSHSRQLREVRAIVAVSGGSITAAHFGLQWAKAIESPSGFREVAAELVSFTRSGIRDAVLVPWIWSILLLGRFSRRPSRTERLQAIYERAFKGTYLSALAKPNTPFIGLVATERRKFARIVFSGEEMFRLPARRRNVDISDYRTLNVSGTHISLAVAASSCFPPVFSPLRVQHQALGLTYEEFGDSLLLHDGGVIGNLGIEVVLHLLGSNRIKGDKLYSLDAERPQAGAPSASISSLYDEIGGALSEAAKDAAKVALGDRFRTISLAERPASGWLDFRAYPLLSNFRTDLDAPSWQEAHALMLLGFASAWTSANPHLCPTAETVSQGERILNEILQEAGCPSDLQTLQLRELECSAHRPIRNLLGHAALATACAAGILFVLISSFWHTSVQDVSQWPKPQTEAKDPSTPAGKTANIAISTPELENLFSLDSALDSNGRRVWRSGAKLRFTISHNLESSHAIVLDHLKLTILSHHEIEQPALNYALPLDKYRNQGKIDLQQFWAKLSSGKVRSAGWITSTEGLQVTRPEEDLFTTSAPLVFELTPGAGNESLPFLGTIIVDDTGLYNVRLTVEYTVLGQRRSASVCEILIYGKR